MRAVTKIAQNVARRFGMDLVRKRADLLHYQHDYGAGGYAAYRRLQIEHNKRKFENVWAEDRTLDLICDVVRQARQARVKGICHGARNGWEVQKFKDQLGCEVIGTDISETAADVPDMVVWDFHETNPEWQGAFSFVYTNSLDQAFDPEKALGAWSEQLTDDGLIFVEHTMFHSPTDSGEMDPFGAHPMIMPYLFFEWGRGKYRLIDIIRLDDVQMGAKGVLKTKGQVWVFVLGRNAKAGV
jgi:hypothetical protein